MSDRPTRHDLSAKARDLRDTGVCVLAEVLTLKDQRDVREHLVRYLGNPDPEAVHGFGLKIFALFARLPRLREPLYRGDVRALCESVLGGPFVVRQSVARLSGPRSVERIDWHHHHAWSAEVLARRARCERLGILCYVDGTAGALGPLLVKRRAFDDPLESFGPNDAAPRVDEVAIEVPPRSIVVLDAAVMHSAIRRTTPGFRILFGAQVQSASLRRPHAEDDPASTVWRLRAKRWLGSR